MKVLAVMFRKLIFGLILALTLMATGVMPAKRPVDSVHAYRDTRCNGYTIIEFGKAINCNGDTIKLGRKNGLQVLIAEQTD